MVQHHKTLKGKELKIKEKITLAALEVFSKYGYDKTTISDIAKQADIADGTVYLYFHNKNDLAVYTYNRAIKIVLIEIDKQIGKIQNPLAKFYSFYDAAISVFQERPDLITFIVTNMFRLPKVPISDPVFDCFREFMGYIQQLCQEAIDKGFLREVDSEILTYHAHSILDYIARLWVVSGYEADMTSLKNKMLEVLMYGLIP